jgi:hypothetical protein
MKRKILFLVGSRLIGLLMVLGLCTSCLHMPSPSNPLPIVQGIHGYVRKSTGNQMPSLGSPRRKPRGMPSTIYIFPVVNLSQVEPDLKASFYKTVRAKVVKVVQSDSTGYFQAALDTGQYSLFVRIGDLYYAAQTDQFNHLAPATVKPSAQTYVELTVHYGAVY